MQDHFVCPVRGVHLHRSLHIPLLRSSLLNADGQLPLRVNVHSGVGVDGPACGRFPLPLACGAGAAQQCV